MRKTIVTAALLLSTAARGLAGQGLVNMVFRTPDPNTPDTVSLFVDGSLRSSASESGTPTLPTGSLGVMVQKQTVLMTLLIAVAGSTSPLTQGHALSLLAPGTGGSLTAGYGELRYAASGSPNGRHPYFRPGFRTYVTVSTAQWTDTITNSTVGVLAGGMGAGAFLGLFGGTITQTSTSPDDSSGSAAGTAPRVDTSHTRLAGVLDIGVAWRTLGGEIASRSHVTELDNIFGSHARNRVGLEAGLTIQWNDLKANLTYYLFSGDVPGLSRGQVLAGFAVSTPLLKGALQ